MQLNIVQCETYTEFGAKGLKIKRNNIFQGLYKGMYGRKIYGIVIDIMLIINLTSGSIKNYHRMKLQITKTLHQVDSQLYTKINRKLSHDDTSKHQTIFQPKHGWGIGGD